MEIKILKTSEPRKSFMDFLVQEISNFSGIKISDSHQESVIPERFKQTKI